MPGFRESALNMTPLHLALLSLFRLFLNDSLPVPSPLLAPLVSPSSIFQRPMPRTFLDLQSGS